jgi:hypothetical protein
MITVAEYNIKSKSGSISIKPFITNSQNMGLERANQVLFDNVYHEEQLACIEANGVKRYLTGLNEFAPEIKKIPDEELREAKIKEIRKAVSEIEKEIASNVIDPEDPQFWNKVKLLRPDNDEFWSKITLRCGNDPVFLDPVANVFDRIKLHAIDAGGFSLVAKSYEDAKNRQVAPKFFLDRFIDTVSTKTEMKKIKNKALSELQKLYDKTPVKLKYVAKIVDLNSVQYKKDTPNDVIYENMDNFINGLSFEKSAYRASQDFLNAAAQDMETLKLRSVIKDALFYKIIILKSDGFIYHTESNAMLGRNASDVLEFLKNPINDQILGDVLNKVEKQWNS